MVGPRRALFDMSEVPLCCRLLRRAGVAPFHYPPCNRKADIRLPRNGISNSHGARPVHQIVSMIKWIRTSGLSIKHSLSLPTMSSVSRHGIKACQPLTRSTDNANSLTNSGYDDNREGLEVDTQTLWLSVLNSVIKCLKLSGYVS